MTDCCHLSKSHIKNNQLAYHGPFQGMIFARNKGAAPFVFLIGSWHFVWGHSSRKQTGTDILLVNENGCPLPGRVIHRDFMNVLRQGSINFVNSPLLILLLIIIVTSIFQKLFQAEIKPHH